MSLRRAAARFSVSPATAHRWWHRWWTVAVGARRWLIVRRGRSVSRAADGGGGGSRSCAPGARPTSGPAGWPGSSGRARSTIWKVLRRHGLSRRPRGQRQSYRRYEWSRPGALLHMDVKKLARFSVPGHRATGDRSRRTGNRGIGYDHLHCVVDDHSRIAYVELHPARGRRDQRAHARARPCASSPSSASSRPRRS